MRIFEARAALVAEVVRQGGLDADVDRLAGGERVQQALRLCDRQLIRATPMDIVRWAAAYCTAAAWRLIAYAA